MPEELCQVSPKSHYMDVLQRCNQTRALGLRLGSTFKNELALWKKPLKQDDTYSISDGKCSVTMYLELGSHRKSFVWSSDLLQSKKCQSWQAELAACSEIYQVMILPLSEIHFVAFLLLTSALACHRSQHVFPSLLLSNVFDITGNWKVLKPKKDIQ